jgi:hypothetical protein
MRQTVWWQITTGKSVQLGTGIPTRCLIHALKFPACILTGSVDLHLTRNIEVCTLLIIHMFFEYIHTFTYTYINTQTHIHTYIHTYVRAHIHACMHTYIHHSNYINRIIWLPACSQTPHLSSFFYFAFNVFRYLYFVGDISCSIQ